MNNEIFGPLLPIVQFEDINEAISLINSKPKPLALYLFGSESSVMDNIIKSTSSGDACINQCAVHFLHHNLGNGFDASNNIF